MPNLVCKDTIHVSTQHGPCTLDLMVGDITTLHPDDAVDFVLVSAFPGDYTIVPGTLIGALYQHLHISVRKLSNNKELDLRKHFSMWMSKPLEATDEGGPPPFKRLICFERVKAEHPASLVGDIFRGLMPIVNNQDTTIITPLLATGNQKFSPSVMMSAMVTSACNWMKVGLPLRCLKIVIYAANSSRLSKTDSDVIDLFSSLKAKWGKSAVCLNQSLLYDVYLSYNPVDSALAEKITKSLKSVSTDVKVFNKHQKMVSTLSWQEEMFNTMNSCKRIVVVLTCAFMESKECLEQFNIGMCCSRVRGYEMLAPLLIQDIPYVPSYIMLVQYIDCRQIESEKTSTGLTTACTTIVSSLSMTSVQPSNKYNYDVFISYSHQKPDQAKHMIELFSKHNSSIKVFYDASELESGYSWQKLLYTCLDNCRCMMAFVCDEYLASRICVEELSIAAARAMTQNDFYLITVCIDDLTAPPSWLLSLNLIDARPQHYAAVSQTVCSTICSYLSKNTNASHKLHLNGSEFKESCMSKRLKEIQTKFVVGKIGLVSINNTDEAQTQLHCDSDVIDASSQCDVYFCYSQDDMTYAAILGHMISNRYGDVVMSYGHESPSERRQKLDVADVIVVFLSQKFIDSTQLMDELHHAVFRSRNCRKKVTYIVQASEIPPKPTFVNILPCDVNLTDTFWLKLAAKMVVKHTKFLVTGSLHGSYNCDPMRVLGLQKASMDVCTMLLGQSHDVRHHTGVFLNVLDDDDDDSTVITMDELFRVAPVLGQKQGVHDIHTETIPSEESYCIEGQTPPSISEDKGENHVLQSTYSNHMLLEREKHKSSSCCVL